MKAQQQNVASQNDKIVRQTASSEPRKDNFDRLYAAMRRLSARVIQVESQLATIRRDVNRVDRKVYRDAGEPSIKNFEAVKDLPDNFGELDTAWLLNTLRR